MINLQFNLPSFIRVKHECYSWKKSWQETNGISWHYKNHIFIQNRTKIKDSEWVQGSQRCCSVPGIKQETLSSLFSHRCNKFWWQMFQVWLKRDTFNETQTKLTQFSRRTKGFERCALILVTKRVIEMNTATQHFPSSDSSCHQWLLELLQLKIIRCIEDHHFLCATKILLKG